MDIRHRIQSLLGSFGTDQKRAEVAAYELMEAYSAPGRHYHDIAHIEALLALADAHRGLLHEPHSVELAILYHDAVYDARRSDNESQSAVLARDRLTLLGAPPATVERVAILIDMTRHGATEPPPADVDALCFIDWDLSVLGAAPLVYDAYAAAIRREYAHVPDAAFREGRGKVLAAFLAQPQIYRVPDFQRRWEMPARANMQREIAALAV
jgi:predicted metal-dependent HD superfamily phosphohydrolase